MEQTSQLGQSPAKRPPTSEHWKHGLLTTFNVFSQKEILLGILEYSFKHTVSIHTHGLCVNSNGQETLCAKQGYASCFIRLHVIKMERAPLLVTSCILYTSIFVCSILWSLFHFHWFEDVGIPFFDDFIAACGRTRQFDGGSATEDYLLKKNFYNDATNPSPSTLEQMYTIAFQPPR